MTRRNSYAFKFPAGFAFGLCVSSLWSAVWHVSWPHALLALLALFVSWFLIATAPIIRIE